MKRPKPLTRAQKLALNGPLKGLSAYGAKLAQQRKDGLRP